jgi:hypothetical protein
MTYEQVASVQSVAEGIIKSRVNRARVRLAGLLCMETRHEIGANPVVKAASQESLDRVAQMAGREGPRRAPRPASISTAFSPQVPWTLATVTEHTARGCYQVAMALRARAGIQ